MKIVIFLILCLSLLISCEHVVVDVGVTSPYTYEVCETVLVTEYDVIERECAEVHSHHDVDYCVDLIDEFVYEYPEMECIVGDYYGYSYVGLHLTHDYLFTMRESLVDRQSDF